MNKFFLHSIRDSQKGYISDPWVFLRELAQNSRDSGAMEIRIDPGGHGTGNEVVIFSDNGHGMTYGDAEKYLFRLYSSSKFKESASVGMYGVGFWTVMKYEPDEVLIESWSTEEEKWAVVLGKNLTHRRAECKLAKYGTRITLMRKSRYQNYEDFCHELELGVRRYSRYLDRKEEKGKILPVIFRGKLISEGFKAEEGISLKYGGRNFEGVVKLGEVPRVTILTGGIPAWEGVTLDELSLINSGERGGFNYMKSGIAPVFHINGRNLKVNMSRREVMDDRSLREIVKKSRKALNELVQICSDHAYPRSRLKRIRSAVKKGYREVTSSYWKIILAVLIMVIPLEIYILNKILPAGSVKDLKPDVLNVEGYRQYSAVVNKLGPRVVADITYTPAENIWFKMFTAPDYNRVRGFVWDGSANYLRPSPADKPGGEEFRVHITATTGGDIFLPCPAGFRIDEESIAIRGTKRIRLQKSKTGEVILNVPGYNRTLEYTCFKFPGETESGYRKKYLEFPDNVRFPDEVEAAIKGLFYQSMENKISRAIGITNILISYDISEGTAAYYRTHREKRNWLQTVLEIGAGDCDVINGVLCLILRKAGVRSRLVVGLVGEKGHMLPNLHSWVEYYENGWKMVDAAPTAPMQGRGSVPDEEFSFIEKSKTPKREIGAGIPALLLKVFLLLLLLSIIPGVLVLRDKLEKERERKTKLNPRNKVKARRDIIEIGKSYLLAPEMWNFNFDIVEQEIITTISGKNISIKQGLRLLKQRSLFSGSSGNPLVEALKKTEEVVVDSDNTIQHPLIRLFHGVIDLDGLLRLSTDFENTGGDEFARGLMAEVNRVLKTLGWKKVSCAAGKGMNSQTFRDIDLSVISSKKFFRKTGYPRKFIAVNMESPEFAAITGMYRRHPELAVHRFFELISHRSLFFYDHREISTRKILRSILNRGV